MEVAIKKADGTNSKEQMLDEAMAMIRVSKHDHIVNFQGVCIQDESVYLLLEFCANGPIDAYLRKNAHDISTKPDNQRNQELIQWCIHVADGMDFLVKKNIIHVSFLHLTISYASGSTSFVRILLKFMLKQQLFSAKYFTIF